MLLQLPKLVTSSSCKYHQDNSRKDGKAFLFCFLIRLRRSQKWGFKIIKENVNHHRPPWDCGSRSQRHSSEERKSEAAGESPLGAWEALGEEGPSMLPRSLASPSLSS